MIAAVATIATRTAVAARVPPGQEALVAEMLGAGATLASGCRLDGASIGEARIDARYRCAGSGATSTVTLLPPETSAPTGARRTERFLILADPPAGLLDDVEARVRAREAAWIWDVEAEHVPAANPIARRSRVIARPWPRSMVAVVVAAVLFAAGTGSALAFSALRGRARGATASRERASPFAVACALLAIAGTALALARFHHVFDDYRFLVRARDDPWAWDESLRVLSTSCVFRLATVLGQHGVGVFLAANAAALLAAATAWGRTARRLGLDRDGATLAAALFALAPGATDLLERGSGIENLGGSACVAVALAAVAAASTPATEASAAGRRIRLLAFAAAITLLGVFVKYPLVAVAPPAAALVALALDRTSARRAIAVGIGLTLLVAIPSAIALAPASARGLMGSLGVSRVGANAASMLSAVAPRAASLTAAAGILASGRVIGEAHADAAPGAVRRAMGRLLADGRAALRTSAGRFPLLALSLALFTLFAAPALVNASYFASYYAFLPFAALALPAGALLVRVARPGRRPARAIAVAVLALLPALHLRPVSPERAAERATAWLDELAHAVAGSPEPDRLVLTTACGGSPEDARSSADVAEVLAVAGERYGVRWVTGWRATDVLIAAAAPEPWSPGDLLVACCTSKPIARLAPPSP
jgi:hypothetical protein